MCSIVATENNQKTVLTKIEPPNKIILKIILVTELFLQQKLVLHFVLHIFFCRCTSNVN